MSDTDERFRDRPVSDAFKRAQDHELHDDPYRYRKVCRHCQAFLVLMSRAPVAHRRER